MKTLTTETQTPILGALATSLGLTLTASAPYASKDPDWQALAYQCTLSRNGKPIWEGEFHLGLGHVTREHWIKARILASLSHHFPVLITLSETPYAQLKDQVAHLNAAVAVAAHFKIAPSLPDVLHSLLLDGSADFNAQSFEDWCSELGYDTDSRKALGIYEACIAIGRKLRASFTPEELQALQEAASNF